MKIINKAFDVILKTIMCVSTLGVIVISSIQIISRFITQLSIGWSTDIMRMCFIYAVFSGIAYCAKRNEHINLDIVLALFPKKGRKIIETIILLVVLVFCLFLTWHGVLYAKSGLNQAAPFTQISMAYYYSAIPVSTGIMSFYYAQLFVKDISSLIKGKEQTIE